MESEGTCVRTANALGRWWESYFTEDYFVLYTFADERTDRECEFLCRELKLQPGMRVLDLCCGHGRHLCHPTCRPLKPVGLDLEHVQLDKARARMRARGLPVRLVRADVRFLPFRRAFDVVLSMFTSYGYFDDDGNAQVLSQARQAMRPGGRLLIDLPNIVASCRRGLHPHWVERGKATVLEEFRRDAHTGRLMSRKVVIDGRGTREYRFSCREYTLPELRQMLAQAGFEIERVWGGYDGSAFTGDAARMIVLARS